MIENFIVHMRGRVVFDMKCGDTSPHSKVEPFIELYIIHDC